MLSKPVTMREHLTHIYMYIDMLHVWCVPAHMHTYTHKGEHTGKKKCLFEIKCVSYALSCEKKAWPLEISKYLILLFQLW